MGYVSKVAHSTRIEHICVEFSSKIELSLHMLRPCSSNFFKPFRTSNPRGFIVSISIRLSSTMKLILIFATVVACLATTNGK